MIKERIKQKKPIFLLTVITAAIIGLFVTLAPRFNTNAGSLITVDDTVTDTTARNYFTFDGPVDPSGLNGWAADTKSSIKGDTEAQTQHWVWNTDNTVAKKMSYTFTFYGTGVELFGVKNDATNNFQLDGGEVETVTINGAANTPVSLYKKTGLKNGQHTVKVTLPDNGTGLQVSYAKVESTEEEEVQTKIPHTKTTGSANFFTFSKDAWNVGNNEHTWSLAPSADLPADKIWYSVDFIGHAIDVYAGKNAPMGQVTYYIDGQKKGTYSLKNPSNINSMKIASFLNLGEGKHTLKAVAEGDGLIDASHVIVYHDPYKVASLTMKESSLNLSTGDTKSLTPVITPDYAQDAKLNWQSADETVSTVNQRGEVTAKAAGQTTITASVPNSEIKAQATITVKQAKTEFVGSIVSTDTQWTNNRADELSKLNQTSAELTAWKNDSAISELAFLSKNGATSKFTVEASDFVGTNGTIPAKQVNLSLIKSTKAYNGDFLGYGSTTRPVPEDNGKNRSQSTDIIDWSTSGAIARNAVQPVWMRINVPKNQAAGQYTGTIRVTSDESKQPLEFKYTVNVQDATLPDAKDFEKGFDVELWQYPYTSAEYYGVKPFSEEHLDILRRIMSIYKSVGGHAITTSISEDAWSGQTYSKNKIHYPSMVKWTKQSDGTMSYDWTDFDKWVQLNKDMGIGDKIVLYSIAPWHNSFTYWENGKLVQEPFKVGSDHWKAMWTDFLKAAIKHLEQKGWFEESYIGIDERGFSNAAFDLIDSVKNEKGQAFKTAGAMDGYKNKYDQALRVTDLNVGDFAASEDQALFDKLVADRAKKGYRTTLYSCTEHRPSNFLLSAPVESYWTAINAGQHTDGFLRWAYDAWVENPLEDGTHNAFEPGDCFLIYPTAKNQPAGAVPSLRLEQLAAATRDMNKIKLMVKEVPALQSQVDAMYGKVSTIAHKDTYNYLSADEIKRLSAEMTTFKADLAQLTTSYIAAQKGESIAVEKVTLTAAKNQLLTGDTVQLTAGILPATVIDQSVHYQSSDATVATVSDKGLVTALKAGTTTITATSNADSTKKASLKITVNALPSKYAYYSFDDKDAKDSWGSRTGQFVGTPSFVSGKSSNALKLTKGQSVTFAEPVPFAENHDWSLAYWVQADALTDHVAVATDASGRFSTDLKMAADRDSGFRVGTGAGDVLTFKYDFKPHTWYHLTWVQDKTKGLSLYVNGKLINTNNWTATHPVSAPMDVLGAADFSGLLDEVKMYSTALDQNGVNDAMLVPGVNLAESSVTLDKNATYQIKPDLKGDAASQKLTYTSADDSIASVDAKGLVTAHKYGQTNITVKAGQYQATLSVTVEKKLSLKNELPRIDLPEKNLSVIEKAPGTDRQYLGQPDMIRTKTGRLITAYPVGHGHGPVIMRISEDNGVTWTEKKDTPASWKNSMETPTLYTLDRGAQGERLIMITACPGWGDGSTGWNTSYSDDNGETWTEYKHWYSKHADGTPNDSIVGMASLIQLHDKNGQPIQKWMGVYHNSAFVNYKTYLTFDEDGNEQWSEPEPYLSAYRDIEARNQICEVGMFRSPDGSRIVGMARSQSHNNFATLFYSDDEGQTWSKPMDLPGSLAGERFKPTYDPISGRLVIPFREIRYDLNNNNQFDGYSDWTCGEWVAWVGTYDQLMNQEQGDYMIQLEEDFTQNAKSGDCGYSGIVALPDGTFVINSYGHWDEAFSKEWQKTHADVRTDLSYIKQARFTLAETDQLVGIKTDKSALQQAITKAKTFAAKDYSAESFKTLTDALKSAQTVNDRDAQQIEIDQAATALLEAIAKLEPAVKPEIDADLLALITQAEKIDGKQYTVESYNALVEALTAAKKLDATAKPEDVAKAKDTLNTALKQLVKIKDDQGSTPEVPGDNTPGTDKPGTNKPGTDKPGTNKPGTDKPGTNKPGTDKPGTNLPGTGNPGSNLPGTGNTAGDKGSGEVLPQTGEHTTALLSLFGFMLLLGIGGMGFRAYKQQ